MTKYPREFEEFSRGHFRMQVHGGWIVEQTNPVAGMLFVPDPTHKWFLEEVKPDAIPKRTRGKANPARSV